jgi:ubiquinone biosynthesis protein COQ4
LPPSVYGEIVVKWIEMTQTGIPMTVLSSIVGPALLKNEEKIKLFREFVPYSVDVGRKSKNLMTIYFEKYLEEDIDEFRNRIHFPKCNVKL